MVHDLNPNLCELYSKYNRREYVHPDPLEFLYKYSDPLDREVVGLIASSLAYGNVKLILRSVSDVLSRMCRPREFILSNELKDFIELFRNFKYRFTTGLEFAYFLEGIRCVLIRYGSLGECFSSGMSKVDDDTVPGLIHFVELLSSPFPDRPRSLLPKPELGSACKRLHLYLRWMIREDEVDPGGWMGVSPSKLVVPLDVHMSRISLRLKLTRRKPADLKSALEVTRAFRCLSPEDPVKFDFCLTRLGIRDELDPEEFLSSCTGAHFK
jgi:uncharacterized protein (TIGR02757 family)